MSDKPKVRRSGSFWAESSDGADSKLRASVIEQQWNNYRATGDIECLAQIAEHADFFGNEEARKEVAATLRDQNRRKKGVDFAIEWDWIISLYEKLEQDPEWQDAPKDALRMRVAEAMRVPGEERGKWCERLRKRLAKHGQGN